MSTTKFYRRGLGLSSIVPGMLPETMPNLSLLDSRMNQNKKTQNWQLTKQETNLQISKEKKRKISTIWVRGFQQITNDPPNIRVQNSLKNNIPYPNVMSKTCSIQGSGIQQRLRQRYALYRVNLKPARVGVGGIYVTFPWTVSWICLQCSG